MSIQLAITELDDEGAGVALVESRRLHIAGAVPGDRVVAHVEHVSRHRGDAWARLLRLERASPDRVEPRCGHHGDCTGCALMPLAYAAQLRAKQARVRRALPQDVSIDRIVPAPEPWGYRGTQKYVVIRRGKTVLGSYAARSHRVADMSGCPVARPALPRIADAIATLCDRGAAAPRHVVLREVEGGVLVTLVATGESAAYRSLARALRERCPEIVSVVLSLSAEGNRILGKGEQLLDGTPPAESPRVFRQPNAAQAERLYADLARDAALTGSETVLDLYAGAGAIARALAPLAARTIAVDLTPSTPAPGVDVIAADVADFLRDAPHADLAIVNPPRRGLTPEVTGALARLRPARLFYVSCNPETLGRDLARLAPTYVAVRATPYDMLPQTPHVEIFARLAVRA